MRRIPVILALSVFVVACPDQRSGQQPHNEIVSETFDRGEQPKNVHPQPLPTMADLINVFSATPIVDLGPLTAEEQRELESTEGEGEQEKIGVTRRVQAAPSLAADAAASVRRAQQQGQMQDQPPGTVWTIGITSAGAVGLRLHVSRVAVPPGTAIYATDGKSEVFGPYDPKVLGTEFWTNTIRGSTAYLQVKLPTKNTPADLVIDLVGHITSQTFAADLVRTEAAAAPFNERNCPERCLMNESCLSTTDQAKFERVTRAVAKIAYAKGNSHFICSGGLLRDKSNSGTPYFLTAAHCFSTEASAHSMEAFWRFKRPDCSTRPTVRARTNGAKLLKTTGTQSDATFVVLLQQPPADSYFMPWTNAAVHKATGTTLLRIHHPHGCSQYFTRYAVFNPGNTNCAKTVRPFGRYIYTSTRVGCTQKGSSGSLLWNENFQVVGQLYGACGGTVDGALAVTYPAIKEWLEK